MPIPKKEELEKKNDEIKVLPRKSRKKVNHDVEVKISNNMTGSFIYVDSKTQQRYELSEYKNITYMTVGELLNMRNKNKSILDKFWIILEEVDDDEITLDDVLSYLNMKETYDLIKDYLDVEKVLNEVSIDDFTEIFTKLPKEYISSMIDISKLLYKQGKFVDHRKIKFIENITNFDDLYN